MKDLNELVRKLGDGELIEIDSKKALFKLDSYHENPIIKPEDLNLTWIEDGEVRTGAVFNGGAEIHEGEVILTPRCHRNYRKVETYDEKLRIERWIMENYISEVWILHSRDGVNFNRVDEVVIRGDGSEHKDFVYGIEDVRIVKPTYVNGYVLVGCGKVKPPFKGRDSDRVAIYTTSDFKEIDYRGIIRVFDSRNTIPFPELIDDKLYMVFRFYPNIHIDFLSGGVDQLLNPMRYDDDWLEVYRRRERNILLKAGDLKHEKEKIGAGPQLIKTKEGWLMIYHAVGEISEDIGRFYGVRERIDRGYSVCAALLSLDDPREVIAKTTFPIYIPSHPWELRGNNRFEVDVPNVVFPVGAIVVRGKLLLYCGAGDKYVILLSCKLKSLLNYLLQHCLMKGSSPRRLR